MGLDPSEEAAVALRELRKTGRRYKRATDTLDRAVTARDEAIIAAARHGAGRQAIADAAGVSIQRVKQVLAQGGAVRPYGRPR